jgi:hypothetical protein
MIEDLSSNEEALQKLGEALNDPALSAVMVSNRMRKRVLGWGLDECAKNGVIVNRKLPGCVMLFYFNRREENLKISTFDEIGSVWAMDFGRNPDWSLLKPMT